MAAWLETITRAARKLTPRGGAVNGKGGLVTLEDAKRNQIDAVRTQHVAMGRIADPSWVWGNPITVVPRSQPMGTSGTAIYAGRIRYEEFNSDLENEKGFGRYSQQGIYDLMRKTDPQVARSLKLLKLPIRSAKWVIEPAEDTPEAREHADFVGYNLFECLAWDPILGQSLTFLDFGFSLMEALEDVYPVSRSRFPGLKSFKAGRPGKGDKVNATLYKSIELRPAKTVYRWKADPENPTQVQMVQQLLAADDNNAESWRVITGDRLIRFTHEQEGQNFQGTSVLRPVFKPWFMKDTLERLDAIRHERQNVGVPVIELPQGADQDAINKADLILSHLSSHEQGYVTLPFGWKISWLVSNAQSGTDVGSAIERLKRDIADNIMAGFMNLGNTSGPGSYALADTQADMYLLNIEAYSRYVEETWNHGHDGWSPVKRLIDLNYGEQEKYPKLKVTNLRSRDYAQVLPLVAELVRFGAITPTIDLENFIRARLDLPANEMRALMEVDEVGNTQDDESTNPKQGKLKNPDQPLAAPNPPPRENETTKTPNPKSAPAPEPVKK